MQMKLQWFLQEQDILNINITRDKIIWDFFNMFTQEIAIDLGTANTLIIQNDKVVVDEPSIVAIDRTTNKVIAIGKRAQQNARKSARQYKNS